MAKKEDLHKINKQITSWEVRLVGENIEPNIYTTYNAIQMARELGLDLIEINSATTPPICRIEDYKKFLYDKKKKIKDLDKKNKLNQSEVKELRFTPNTDDHDFNFKLNHAINFLKKGDKVKTYVFFKGREISYKDKGEILLLKLANELSEIGIVESMPKMEGHKMYMTIKPKKSGN